MTMPTIHLNGTSQADLFGNICTAGETLQDAMDALAKTAPNGRDYYPQGQSALGEALRDHNGRMDKLQAVYAELQGIAAYLSTFA